MGGDKTMRRSQSHFFRGGTEGRLQRGGPFEFSPHQSPFVLPVEGEKAGWGWVGAFVEAGRQALNKKKKQKPRPFAGGQGS